MAFTLDNVKENQWEGFLWVWKFSRDKLPKMQLQGNSVRIELMTPESSMRWTEFNSQQSRKGFCNWSRLGLSPHLLIDFLLIDFLVFHVSTKWDYPKSSPKSSIISPVISLWHFVCNTANMKSCVQLFWVFSP